MEFDVNYTSKIHFRMRKVKYLFAYYFVTYIQHILLNKIDVTSLQKLQT